MIMRNHVVIKGCYRPTTLPTMPLSFSMGLILWPTVLLDCPFH